MRSVKAGHEELPVAYEMLPYLKDAVRYATDLDVRRWAAETYLESQKYIAERDEIEAENKKRREEYEKKQGNARKKK